jgi:hypothetical protein
MDAATFAEFFREQGHRVVQTHSAYWYDVARRAFNSVPFHRLITPEKEELAQLWRDGGALLARYPTPAQEASASSYMFVCRKKGYSIEDLSANARSHTRRGLKRCEIQRIDFDLVANEGFEVNISTLVRQGRDLSGAEDRKWRTMCEVAARTPDCEAWGAFIDDQLAALVVGFLVEDCYQVSTVRSRQDLLKHYPNNALLYEVTRLALSRPEVRLASYGVESLQSQLSSLVHYKLSMGYEQMPINQQVTFRPALRPFVKLGVPAVNWMADRRPNNPTLRKVQGLLRFAELNPL